MSTYVLYDTWKLGYLNGYSKRLYALPHDAKVYKTFRPSKNAASLMNVSRNIPPGYVEGTDACRHYRSLPQVVVHEFDNEWNLIEVHAAPPDYIEIKRQETEILGMISTLNKLVEET